jgi:tetratricopeptide (TPR) repeat protein
MTGLVLPCDLASLKETWRSCQAVPNIIPVKEELEALVTAGDRALEAGEWSAARDSFRTALELGQTAEALNGLGQALWWLGKTQDSIDYRERAYAEFRRRQDPVQAERGDEKLYAEVKGKTTSRPGVGLDTLYGQLLRRMPPEEVGEPKTRFAVVVPKNAETAALRVPVRVRDLLRVDVYTVTDDGQIEIVGGP